VTELRAQDAQIEAQAVKLAAERLSITKEGILRELARVAFSDVRRACMWCNGAMVIVDSGRIDDDTGAAIAQVSMAKDGAIVIKMHSKLDALKKLGEHLGLFKQHVVFNGNVEVETTDRASARLILEDRLAQVAARLGAHGNRSCADGHAGATPAGDEPLDRRAGTLVEGRLAEPLALVEQ
jgi:hypothetical protein